MKRSSTVDPGRLAGPELEANVRATVERVLQRGLLGLEYISLDDTDVGASPKVTIYAAGTLKLYHYRPTTEEVYRVPLLFVTSLVSKPYILDLTPGQSMIEYLVGQGYDVYLIDWGIPRKEDSRLRLEDYVLDFIPECIERVQAESGENEVSIVGYCMGGTLALIYAALHPEGPIENLALIATPVNFRGMGLFAAWTDRRYFDVDRIVDALGNVPPEMMLSAFDMLRPSGRVTAPLQVWDRMREDKYVKSFLMFDRWAADQIPFPGECFRQVVKELFWENKLMEQRLEMKGRCVDLAQVRRPMFHAMAEHDHIVPHESTKDLVSLAGSRDKTETVLRGGHASLVAGGNAMYRLWPKLDEWLSVRST